MTTLAFQGADQSRRRALVAVQVGVVLVVLLGFAALTVDVGTLYNTRADLQRTADAAALAGASVYATDLMMRIRQDTAGSDELSQIVNQAAVRVHSFAGMNPTFGASGTQVASGDIQTGALDLQSPSATIQTSTSPVGYNAVGVMVRRESGGEVSNGPVEFFFAPIFGRLVGNSSASAVAVFDDRVSGVSASGAGAGILPFTIHRDAFYQDLDFGGDQYAYHEDSGSVTLSSDGIREIRLYPYPLSGSGYEEGDGNFGVLNIGTGNQGVDAEEVQILNGVSTEDLVMEIGTSDLIFHNEAGAPITYDITGSPGLEAALKAPVGQIVGQVVGFFLHSQVVLSGSNAIYTITDIRYGRVMDIRLTGAPHQRGLFVQPVSYTGGEVHIDPEAPSTGGLLGRLVLAR
jgi:hypothetical protein